MLKNIKISDWTKMAHAFNLSTGRQSQVDLYDFEVSLIYTVSSKTARATVRFCLKTKTSENIFVCLCVYAYVYKEVEVKGQSLHLIFLR